MKNFLEPLKMKGKRGVMESVMDNVLYLAIIFIVIIFLLAVILPISFSRIQEVNSSSTAAYDNLSAALVSLPEQTNDLIPIAFGIIALILIFVAIAVLRRNK